MRVLAFTLLTALPAQAQSLECIATTQCRGDAQTMCAESTLHIRVQPVSGAEARLWIDRQGPYDATRSSTGGMTLWTLGAFGGGYTLELAQDGQFTYRGNRGKRYSGSCTEGS